MPNRPGILIANPDPGIRRLLRRTFAAAGYGVTVVDTAAATVTEAARMRPELIVLSASFTDLDAASLIRRTRALTAAPVIVLFQSDGAAARDWLEAGADDYLEEPFLAQDMAARVRRLMARASVRLGPHAIQTAAGLIEIDPLARSVRLAGRTLEVTRREFDLLVLLIKAGGAPVPFADVLERVWGNGYRNARQNLRRVVRTIRNRIEQDPARPAVLISLRGIGYRLVVSVAETADGGAGSSR